MQDAVDATNEIAPEHLEIITKNPWEVMTKVKNAGAIFLGEYYRDFVPNPFGDPDALGNYHEEVGYHDVKKFAGWDQFCKELLIL